MVTLRMMSMQEAPVGKDGEHVGGCDEGEDDEYASGDDCDKDGK